MRPALLVLVAGALATAPACMLEKMPPIVMVHTGEPAPVKRVVLLPSDCGQDVCRGLDALVAADLAFRGYEVIDLDRLAAVERQRTEVLVSSFERHDGVATTSSSRRVEVRGPMLSDVDVWTLRDELRAMNVDSIVRVRTASIFGAPARIATLVRVTRADDARLIASALCELEVGTFDTFAEGAERSARCALAKVLR